MLLLGRDQTGERFEQRVRYRPYLFIEHEGSAQYRTAIGQLPVRKKLFDSMYDASNYIKTYEGVENSVWYGSERWLYNFINDEFPDRVEFDLTKIRVGYIDIEVKSDNGFPNPMEGKEPIQAITVSNGKEFFVFGLKPYLSSDATVHYARFDSEAQLLSAFLVKWEELEFDVLSGWNSSGFDIPFLYHRILNVLGKAAAELLSPFGGVFFREGFDRNGRATILSSIDGISNLDYYNLYQKFTYSKQEQYTLDYISRVELGEAKLGYAEFGSLENLYEQDFQRYIDYNVQDVRLVIGLENKMKLIELAITLAYTAKVNYEDSMTSVLLWDVIIRNYLMERGLVVPRQHRNSKNQPIAGAYVKDPKVGLYHWVMSFDAASLYPSLIRQLNISPDKFRGMIFDMRPEKMLTKDAWLAETEQAKKNGLTVAGNGAAFLNDSQGFIPALMEEYFNNRLTYSEEMIECQKELELVLDELSRR